MYESFMIVMPQQNFVRKIIITEPPLYSSTFHKDFNFGKMKFKVGNFELGTLYLHGTEKRTTIVALKCRKKCLASC